MPFSALACIASSGAQRGSKMRSGIFEDWNETEQDTSGERYEKREQQHGAIDPDIVEARKIGGRDRDQQPQRTIGERQSQGAAGERERNAFHQQLASNPLPTCAQRCADG